MPDVPDILFTGFEPSGDDHASAVIAELKSRHPQIKMYAWGGPKMAAAGAELIERTGDNAVMGLPGIGKIIEHAKINSRIRTWMRDRQAQGKPFLHVPVDSPAANFPICKITKSCGMKVMHLVAPQVWAWASWRIRKLRKRTNLVLCLLPFEEEWFLARGVPAKFVGHPLFDEPLDEPAIQKRMERMLAGLGVLHASALDMPPSGAATAPKLALMPGSRPKEMSSCFPILLDAYNRLKKDFPSTTGIVAATTPDAVRTLQKLAAEHGGWPAGLGIVHGETDAVVKWCDYALVVSGTVTLQIARQHKLMVAVYSPSWIVYNLIGRWLVSTDLFTLPNLIAGRKIIPEVIPHWGDGEALAVEVIKLMRRPGYAEDQKNSLEAVCRRFAGKNCAKNAADEIEKILGLAR